MSGPQDKARLEWSAGDGLCAEKWGSPCSLSHMLVKQGHVFLSGRWEGAEWAEVGQVRPWEVLARGDGAEEREKWEYQPVDLRLWLQQIREGEVGGHRFVAWVARWDEGPGAV